MSQFDSIKAFAENINQRKAAMVAGGKTEQEAQDELTRLAGVPGRRERRTRRRGLIGGFGRQGVELGGFERYGRIARETPADFEASRKLRYEDSEQGRQDKIDAARAVADAEMGARQQEIKRRRDIAMVELTKAGGFEQFGGHQVATAILGPMTGENDRSVLANQQMLAKVRGQLGERSGIRDTAASLSSAATDSVMRGLLERIAKSGERTQELLEKPPAQRRPLVAAPPGQPPRH